jgi:hypothetical protein
LQNQNFRGFFFFFSSILSAFVPFKDDKLETDMLKDVAHADVAKNETIDDADANYDDYYDVSWTCVLFVQSCRESVGIHQADTFNRKSQC